MKIGISTATLFGRETTEGALKLFNTLGVNVSEVFLESFSEYNKKFGKTLKKAKGGVEVHSIHTLTTQFEPQLYSLNLRAQQDSFILLDRTMQCAKQIGAKYYTFHGGARFKKTPFTINFNRVGAITQDIISVCNKYGVELAYENVHWCYYNYIGFFNELIKHAPTLKATLDVKQARQSNLGYKEFIDEMGDKIVTVHLSDLGENGKMCLPGKGITDFNDLFSRLKGVGFNGAFIIEAYQNDFNNYEELLSSLEFVKETAYKIF